MSQIHEFAIDIADADVATRSGHLAKSASEQDHDLDIRRQSARLTSSPKGRGRSVSCVAGSALRVGPFEQPRVHGRWIVAPRGVVAISPTVEDSKP